MDKITYKGIEYPTRTLTVLRGNEEETITISTASLYDALIINGVHTNKADAETTSVDEGIYYYVADDEIGMDADKLCNEHLDEPMMFIEE